MKETFIKIVQDAVLQSKGILIIGSPRSGTHVLGDNLSTLSDYTSFGEICMTGYCTIKS
jgi:hypothetical protein